MGTMSNYSFQEQILQDYAKRQLNPFTSIDDDYKVWRREIEKSRNIVKLSVHEYENKIAELQQEAVDVEKASHQLFVDELQRQGGFVTDLQKRIQKLSEKIRTLDLQKGTRIENLESFIEFVTELKDISTLTGQPNTEVPKYTLNPDIQKPLERLIDLTKKSVAAERFSGDLFHEQVDLEKSILSLLKLEITNILNLMRTLSQRKQTTIPTTKVEYTYQVARTINLLQNQIKNIWTTFDTITKSTEDSVIKARKSLQGNIGELKLYLEKVKELPNNPCNKDYSLINPLSVNDSRVHGPLPQKNDPNFALEFRNKIVKTHPQLQLERETRVENRCITDGPFVPTPHQLLFEILLDPRFKRFRGWLLDHEPGSGKTATVLNALFQTWFKKASEAYGVSRDVLILVPNESNIRDWVNEAKKVGFSWREVPGKSTKSVYYIQDGEGEADSMHFVLQTFGDFIDPSIVSALKKNGRDKFWGTFPYTGKNNQYSDYPNIYGTEYSGFPKPFTFPTGETVNNCLLPIAGMIIVDEAHLPVNPESINGTIHNMIKAMSWILSIKMNDVVKLLLLTGTPLADLDRPLDAIKLLNLLKFASEPKEEEGVWKKPIGSTERAVMSENEKKIMKKMYQLEEKFVRKKLETNQWLTWYSGLISYMSLENDPTVFPQITTRCNDGCDVKIEGCMVRYETKKSITPTNCGKNNPELCKRIRAIPVYISLPGKKKKKIAFTPKEVIQNKLAVILDVIKQTPNEKHFIFSESKRYNDFYQHASEIIKKSSIPSYDMVQLKNDLIKNFDSFPFQGNDVDTETIVDQLYKDSSSFIHKINQALLLFVPTMDVASFGKELNDKDLYRLLTKGKNQNVHETVRVRTNRTFLIDILKLLFNHKGNDNGERFQTFVTDLSGREGLTLKLTRHVHFIRVPGKMTTFKQAMARATRHCSFKNELDARKWLVRVYLYILSQDPCELKEMVVKEGEKKKGGKKTINECVALNVLFNSTIDSTGDAILKFIRSAAIDCLLFALYTHKKGEPISCGLSKNMSEETFRSRFMPQEQQQQPGNTLPEVVSSEPMQSSFGRVCLYPNQSNLEVETEHAFVCDAPGEIQELAAYNEMDAFIYRAIFTELETEKQKEITTVTVSSKPTETKEAPKQQQPQAQTKDKGGWWAYFQGLQKKVAPYFGYSQSSNDENQSDRVSFQVMYPYLTCQHVTPGKMSYHKIYQDLKMVSIPYKKKWFSILDLKRKRTAFIKGKTYQKALDDIALIYFSIVQYQVWSHEDLLKIKEGLHTVPTTSLEDLEKKQYNTTRFPSDMAMDFEPSTDNDKGPRPEIQYILTEYNIDKPAENFEIKDDLDLDL